MATEQQGLVGELAAVEERAAVSASRWLAAVAISGDHSPTDSRVLAVEAGSRHQTAEAMAAFSTLLFAEPRTDPPVTLIGQDGPVTATDADAGLLITGSSDATVRLCSGGGTLVTALDDGDVVRAAAVAPAAEAPAIAPGSNDRRAQVWTVDAELLGKAE